MQTDKPNGYPQAYAVNPAPFDGKPAPAAVGRPTTPAQGTQPAGSAPCIPFASFASPSHDIKAADRTPEQIMQRAESIRRNGILKPILGFWRSDKLFEIIDGYTTFLACGMIGFKQLPIRALERIPTETEILAMQVTCQEEHNKLSELQLYECLQRHRKLTGGTQGSACKAFGISPARGSKILAIFSKLPPEVLALELPPRANYALTRLSVLGDNAPMIQLAKKVRDLPMAVESVEEEVMRLLGAKRTKAAKPIKARTGKGLQAIIPGLTYDDVLAELTTLAEAVRKAQKHALPLSSLPQLLRS